MIILKIYFNLYYLILTLKFINCTETDNSAAIYNHENDNNNESIRLHVAALRDQATNLVNQINLMINSHMVLLPTPPAPLFMAEPSVTFLVRPHTTDIADGGNNDSGRVTPANSPDTNLPTPTDFAASRGSNTQAPNSSGHSESTISQTKGLLPSSTSNSNPTPTVTQLTNSSMLLPTSTALPTIDLFPLNLSTSASRHFSIGQDRGNTTVRSETLVVRSLSLASGEVVKMKLNNWCILVALTVPIIALS
jgi:hypothetical protein